MKRKLLAMAMVASMVIGLAACGGGASSGGSASSSASTESESADPASEGTNANAAKGDVKIICPYGVGGTADAIARKYALVAGKLYPDYNFIVENMTGGDGFAAATYYTDQDPSTHELLVYGYGVAYRHDLGKKYDTEVVDFDRNEILPVATVDDRTWILYTTPDRSLADILDQAKNGGIKMSGGNPLSDPHLALGSLLSQEGGKVMVVPYDGGAAQKKGLTDGEVDVFVGTTQAALEDVEAGTLIPILAFSESAFSGFNGPDGALDPVPGIAGADMAPELNASTDYTGSILPAGGYVATRVGADQAWVDEIVEISKAVWADAEYADWIAEIMLNKYEKYGDDAVSHLEDACAKAVAAYELMSAE